jgi:uncharacterized protein YqeY
VTLEQRIEDDLKQAMKARDAQRLGVVRMLKARLAETRVAMRGKHGADYRLSDDDASQAIASYAKQRREAIESYEQAGRSDLAEAERAELRIVESYLPEQLAEDELRRIVSEAIERCGARSPADLGTVMREVMPRVQGRADGKLVNRIAREALAGDR